MINSATSTDGDPESKITQTQADVSGAARIAVAWLSLPIIVLALWLGLANIAPSLVHDPTEAEVALRRASFFAGYSFDCRPEPLEEFRYVIALLMAPAIWLLSYPIRRYGAQWLERFGFKLDHCKR